MKQFLMILTVVSIAIFIVGPQACDAVNYPKAVGHVNDFAGVIDSGIEQRLESMLTSVKQQTGAEIAVVAVGNMDGLDVDTYAVELMKTWGIGSRERNDGVLILLAIEERKWRIEPGYGLEPIITDLEAGQLGRDIMVPLFKAGKYGEGLASGAIAVASMIAEEQGVTLSDASGAPVPVRRRRPSSGGQLVKIIPMIIIFLLIARSRGGGGGLMTALLLGSMMGGGRRHYGGGFGGGSFGGGFGGGGGGFGGFGGGFSGGGGASGGF
ncbi:TPM domain-containing protein [Candidatus Latescibacterota bacterium]